MWTESEIQNFKKNFLDEMNIKADDENFIEVEKIIDKEFEKARNMDFSEDPPELLAYIDEYFVWAPSLSPEENFRNGVRLLKEFGAAY